MNFTWDHFWLAVIVTIIVLLIVGIVWLPEDAPCENRKDNE